MKNRDDKYEKQCNNCRRVYSSNYEKSNPCVKCGCESIAILRGPHPKKKKAIVKSETPKIHRTVTEEWKGTSYTKDKINNTHIRNHTQRIENIVRDRDMLNAKLKLLRYQLAWHQKRDSKNAFD